jgi:predicted ATPase/class 3 adenylate cyclase
LKRCLRCQHDNGLRARFCEHCGAPLSAACRTCGAALIEGSIRCERCGAGRTGPHPALRSGERRQIVVLFCDLVASTRLSLQLDAEAYREVMRDYQSLSAGVVDRFGGHVAQHLGDGLLVYFGYPHAHEDDADRALRAALTIASAVSELQPWAAGERLAVRIGLHFGRAVMAELGAAQRRDVLALGDIAQTAAHLQASAEPNGVVASAALLRLARARYQTRQLPSQPGAAVVPEPLAVLRESASARKHVPSAALPLIGRDPELSSLRRALASARAGAGQLAIVTGEAGIGKSRLVQALREEASADAELRWLECHCAGHTEGSAFWPLIQLQVEAFGLLPQLSAAERLARLASAVQGLGPAQRDALALFANLHSLACPDDSSVRGMSAEAIRTRTLARLGDWLLGAGHAGASVVVFEDLHWSDPSSLELLRGLVARLARARVLLVLTARDPTLLAALPAQLELRLVKLPAQQASELVRAVAGSDLLGERARAIVERGDGVPLFLEELTKAPQQPAANSGEARAPMPLEVPTTLQGLLMARLDRVQQSAKEAAQIGAVLGREFDRELLSALWPRDLAALSGAIDELLGSGLLREQSESEPAAYRFQHVLVQQTAYDSLLRGRRQGYHEQVAQLLTERRPELAAAQPELVAHHFEAARRFDRATPFWLFGGHRAMQRCAHLEAIGHFQRGLSALSTLPESAERKQSELTLQALHSVSLMAVRGYAADEVLASYSRARSLCEGLPDDASVFPVVAGLTLFHLVRGDRALSRDLSERQLRIADNAHDAGMSVRAHGGAAVVQYYLGNFRQARLHAAEVMQRYRADQHRAQLYLYGDDVLIHALIVDGLSSWFLGYPERAATRMQQAYDLAIEIDHAFTTATVHGYRCQIAELRGDVETGARAAEAAIAHSHEQGFPFYEAVGVVHSGWPELRRGRDPAAAEARVREGVRMYRATGARTNVTYFLALAAEACLARGDAAAALVAVDEGLSLADAQLDQYFKPELLRWRGECLARLLSEPARVSALFAEAFAASAASGARSLQLRAAMSELRHARDPLDRARSRAQLAHVYSEFDEGFESADLRAAQALLR